MFALVGTPYTIKFLWAPIVDALDVPVLSPLLGRRRGWLVFSQLLLIAAIVFLAFCDPAASPWLVAFGALLVATASATQDIVIDAFRIESLDESEQAAGMASYVAAYRIGMLASTAGALFLVSGFEGLGFRQERAPGRRATSPWPRWSSSASPPRWWRPSRRNPPSPRAEHAAHARDNPLQRVALAAYGASPNSSPATWPSSCSPSWCSTSSAMRSPAP